MSDSDSGIPTIKNPSTNTGFLKIFFLLLYYVIKWAIIFGLVMGTFPLGKLFYKRVMAVIKWAKKTMDKFLSIEGKGFMGGLIAFFIGMVFLLITLIYFFVAVCVGAMFGVLVYLFSLIINL